MYLRLRCLLLGLWLGFCSGTCAYAQTQAKVVIVSSQRSPAYVEASEALIAELERSGVSRYEMLQITTDELRAGVPLSPQLFIALGATAAGALAKTEFRVPVLCTLLPRSSFERLLSELGRKSSGQFSALYLDQPPSRQLALIRQALPAVRRVGVLWGTESQVQAPALRVQARSHGVDLVEVNVGDRMPIFPALKQVLEDAEVLLALTDAQIYNSNSLQNILLTSFRARVPLVAFSPAYVRAGALMAVHVTPAQLGEQAAVIARGVLLQGKALPNAAYSTNFSVALNEHVAHSLGLTLEAKTLEAQLHRREGTP